jgi:hypothetical protein
MWHWKGVRNGAVGQVDDQYVDDTKDPGQNADWGRKGDAATGGGYKNNVSDDKKRPAFMAKNPADGKYWVLDADKVPFADTFKAGDMVGGVVVAPFTGSRGDIAAQAVWANGKWTLEIKRKLVTSGDKAKQQDVQFSDLKKKYPFGVAVFDNSQINHLYHEGAEPRARPPWPTAHSKAGAGADSPSPAVFDFATHPDMTNRSRPQPCMTQVMAGYGTDVSITLRSAPPPRRRI